jgi:hypothetical protein
MKETTAQPTIKLKTRNIDQKALIVAIIYFFFTKIDVHLSLNGDKQTI